MIQLRLKKKRGVSQDGAVEGAYSQKCAGSSRAGKHGLFVLDE
jgi:hypothetical protein